MTESIYEKIVEVLNAGIIVLEKDGCILTWNQWVEARSGISEKDVKGLPILDVLPELQNTRIARSIKKALEFNCPSVLSAKLIDASFPLYKEQITSQRTPERLVQSIQIKPFYQESDATQHCVISIYDISSADLREKALRNQSTTLNRLVGKLQDKDYELKTLFQNTQNSILIFEPNGQIVNANPAATSVLGYNRAEILKYRIYDLISSLSPSDFSDDPSDTSKLAKALPTKNGDVEMIATGKDKQSIPISVSANVIPYENQPTRFFVFFKDITEKKRAEQRLDRLARYDSLTRLKNRNSFIDTLEVSIQQHNRAGDELSIFFIDLDRFKAINDRMGHEVGDALLVAAADRLNMCCRNTDTIARWAGDEFVLLLTQQSQNRSAITVAEKIVKAFEAPFIIDNREIHSSCSIGIAKFPNDGNDADALISRADHAMYQAKNEGAGTFRFFTNEMNERMQKRLKVESELRRAIKREEFVLHYQPQVNVKTGKLSGVEALIRWQHPTDGMVYPDAFIEIAESCGLIGNIGDWVMATALEDAASWLKKEGAPLKVSINLSPKQFVDEGLVSKLKKLIDSVGVPASSVVIEITEGHLMGNTKTNLVTLNALKALGVLIAIDDFGTGYSSLSYLRTLPVDIIKIDREFLIDASENKTSAHIVAAIIELSHALQLEVIAEGVEYISQMHLLEDQGCDQAQGFYVGKPMHLSALGDWYKKEHKQTHSTH